MNQEGGKREVSKMAWPLAVGMLSFTMTGVVDTLFMGHVSTAALAGVGLANTLFFFSMSFFGGVTQGPQSLVAAADGADDRQRIRQAGSAGVLLGFVTGIMAFALILLVYQPMLKFMVPDQEVIGSAERYLKVRLWGLPFTLMCWGLIGGLQGLGDTRTRMWVGIIGNGVNIILDSVFIFGWGPFPAMAETGAALATVISVVLRLFMYYWRYVKLFGRPLRPSLEVMISSIKIGLPSGMQRLLGVFAFTVGSLVLARVSTVHLAASEIVLNIVSVSFMPGFAIGEAGGILVGRYLGAGKSENAVRTLSSARILALGLMGICGLLFASRGGWLTSFYTPDPAVARLAGVLMVYAAIFQLLDALVMVHLCVLRAVGDTRFSLLVTTVCAWGLTVPITLALGLWLGWGAHGVYLGIIFELIALAGITSWRVGGVKTGKVVRMDLLLGSESS